MRSRVLTATALACAALAASAAAVGPADRLSHSGLGAVKIGMTVAQVEAAAGHELEFGTDAGTGDCRTAELADDVSGLFTRSRLARIYVRDRAYRTTKGIRVGSRESVVLRAYGIVTRSRHTYVRGGEYFKVTLRGRRLVFDTSPSGKVTSMSAGRVPEIDYVEGCA